jgi:hypothetical protein
MGEICVSIRKKLLKKTSLLFLVSYKILVAITQGKGRKMEKILHYFYLGPG